MLSVQDILENIKKKKINDETLQFKMMGESNHDCHRSVLNADLVYGVDELRMDSKKFIDRPSQPIVGASPSSLITTNSTHNMLESTVQSYIMEAMEEKDMKQTSSSIPVTTSQSQSQSQANTLQPLPVSMEDLLRGILPFPNFSVTFSRPDYGKL